MGFLLSVTHGFFLGHENEPEYTYDGIDLKTNKKIFAKRGAIFISR